MIHYVNGTSTEFPELMAGGRNPMAGPIYHYNEETASPHALPPHYENKWIIYEWMRNWVMLATLDENGDLVNLDPFLPGNDYISPMDIEVGPDGRLYILEWGLQFWGNNENAQLVRLDYYGTDENRPEPHKSMDNNAGIAFTAPVNGGFFEFGEQITYEVNLDDKAQADHAFVQSYTGFDTSPFPLEKHAGTAGALVISDAFTHTPDLHVVDRFGKLEACVDEGGAKTCSSVYLNPKTKEAEHTSSQEKATRKPYGAHPASQHFGGTAMTTMSVTKDSRLVYTPVNLSGIDSITLRFLPKKEAKINLWVGKEHLRLLASTVLTEQAGNAVKLDQAVYIEGITGTDRHSMNARNSKAYEGWREITLPIRDPGGTHDLVITLESDESGSLLELDLMRFNGDGISQSI